MHSTIDQLKDRFEQALVSAFGEELAGTDPILVPASNPKFGDYQSNVAMSLAKRLQDNPRAIAEKIVQHLNVADLCQDPDVAGPGFINLALKPSYLQAQLQQMHQSDRLGMNQPKPQRIIVDFSSPNIAKEMHVGHLRTTIIGDSIARILEFLGHDVLRLNHVGDWGTQFGMLITQLREVCPEALASSNAVDLGDLVEFYRKAKQRFDQDSEFKERSRLAVVDLQSGDESARAAWHVLCEQSRKEFQRIYDRLDICIEERGESFYNPLLPSVVADLEAAGLLVEDQGAKCVFLEGFTNKDGDPLPLIVQKSDGGYNYATTDLAAIRYRIQQDHAERIIYVVDAGQASHFAQVFQVANRAGWIPEGVELIHVPFGVVQGEDGKKFKTRSGETVRLRDLLDEAWLRADADLYATVQAQDWEAVAQAELNAPDWDSAAAQLPGDASLAEKVEILKRSRIEAVQRRVPFWLRGSEPMPEIARSPVDQVRQVLTQRWQENRQLGDSRTFESILDDTLAIGTSAVKYGDLSQNRTSNYIFSYDKMLALQGNTAPYLLYAYVRIQGISRKGGIDFDQLPHTTPAPAVVHPDRPDLEFTPTQVNATRSPNYKPLLQAAGLGLLLLITLKVVIAILVTVNSLPLAPTLFELIGIGVSAQFAYKRLLFARDRQRLGQDLHQGWQEIVGSPQPTLPGSKSIEVTAIESPAIVQTPIGSPPSLATASPNLLFNLQDEAELTLAKHLLQLGDVLHTVEVDLLPNRLCQYLFELSQKFNQFFEQCPVLWAEEPQRTSRLALCHLTARTLKVGLSLLGIPVLERM